MYSYFRHERYSSKSKHILWVDYACLLIKHLKVACILSGQKVHFQDTIFFRDYIFSEKRKKSHRYLVKHCEKIISHRVFSNNLKNCLKLFRWYSSFFVKTRMIFHMGFSIIRAWWKLIVKIDDSCISSQITVDFLQNVQEISSLFTSSLWI